MHDAFTFKSNILKHVIIINVRGISGIFKMAIKRALLIVLPIFHRLVRNDIDMIPVKFLSIISKYVASSDESVICEICICSKRQIQRNLQNEKTDH